MLRQHPRAPPSTVVLTVLSPFRKMESLEEAEPLRLLILRKNQQTSSDYIGTDESNESVEGRKVNDNVHLNTYGHSCVGG